MIDWVEICDLEILANQICHGERVKKKELYSGIRKRDVFKCRKIFCQISAKKMGYSWADVVLFLGITTSGVNRLAASDILSDTEEYH